jgi:hypothetical protein
MQTLKICVCTVRSDLRHLYNFAEAVRQTLETSSRGADRQSAAPTSFALGQKFHSVAVIPDPTHYPMHDRDAGQRRLPVPAFRKRMAVATFALNSAYDP